MISPGFVFKTARIVNREQHGLIKQHIPFKQSQSHDVVPVYRTGWLFAVIYSCWQHERRERQEQKKQRRLCADCASAGSQSAQV